MNRNNPHAIGGKEIGIRYVLYHANCHDGFGAAYAARKRFGEDARYIAVSYGYPPPDMSDATEIFIVDFSYDPDVIFRLAETAQVVVLDHHKTAEEKLRQLSGKENPFVIFDMSRSGACPTNILIDHISDRDLWTYKLNGSREVHAALVSLPFDFEVWDKLVVDDLIKDGAACLRFQSKLVDNIVKKSWIGKVGDHAVPIVNTSSSWSEVGEALLAKYPDAPFAASFTTFKDIIMWSLRSRGEFDVSEVAKKNGGGGHKAAAGFQAVRP